MALKNKGKLRRRSTFAVSVKFILLASISFAIGRSWRSLRGLHDDAHHNREATAAAFPGLIEQIKAQAEIQRLIQEISDPTLNCLNSRVLATELEKPKDGFASEAQYVARLLQMAVSTNRFLVFTPNWKSAYEPIDCQSESVTATGWECLWEPVIPTCSLENLPSARTLHDNLPSTTTAIPGTGELSSLSTGILPQKQSSAIFDVALYGQNQLARSPTSFSRREDRINLRADIISHWERAHGRYWVRAQMAHRIWKPNKMLQSQINARLPSLITGDGSGSLPYIGFHVRYTDNIHDLQKHFARNATISRSFARLMQFANEIRTRHAHGQLSHIYLATDNEEVVKLSQQPKWKKLGWKFVSQKNVQRSTTLDRLWFREGRSKAAAAIAADIEALRQADYLVGSFQSNVYRLACELNTAWHVKKYPLEMHRHWTVDVEWYEDP